MDINFAKTLDKLLRICYHIITERGETLKGKEVRRMYEVTTISKTYLKTADEVTAKWWAKILFNTHNYVEVKRIISENPWRAESVLILTR